MNNFAKLVAAILVCEGAGIIGSIFTIASITSWYATLIKPPFNPPNWIFGPVWTILYLFMGISLYLVWLSKKSAAKKEALQIFFAQLILNSLWSIIFFGMHYLVGGLIIIIGMWILIYLTIKKFAKFNKTASYLLYPYLAWVSFAAILNLAIVFLNR